MRSFVADLEKETLENKNFRKVLFTGSKSQLVVMSLLPGEEIGEEIHDDNDQFIRVESGRGKAVIAGEEHDLADGVAVVVCAGVNHNIINTSDSEDLKLYTVYSPAHHKDGTVHVTKEEALQAEKH